MEEILKQILTEIRGLREDVKRIEKITTLELHQPSETKDEQMSALGHKISEALFDNTMDVVGDVGGRVVPGFGLMMKAPKGAVKAGAVIQKIQEKDQNKK
ncbi:hypothetical protein ACFPOG_12395 [Paenibacillus aestuarii]|uniref:Uncharacterized protein n=1 Tax=Paenibacillus aestuarii TaxID=516965 RepID=A0ABW0K6M0_9BACL